MKLSEAIRLGAMASEKADGWFWLPDGSTCALGSALLAIGRLQKSMTDEASQKNWGLMAEAWPWLASPMTCPACGYLLDGRHVVAHLNNTSPVWADHGWTRAQIADWVATIEPADAEVAPQPVAEAVRA